MMMKYYKLLISGLIVFFFIQSCERRDNYDEDLAQTLNIINELKGNNTSASLDHLQGIINLVLPPRSDASNVTLEIDVPSGIQISPSSGSVVDLTSPIQLLVTSSNSTRVYTLYTKVLPNQIAFLGNQPTYNDLIANADDDVASAAQWLKDTYPQDFIYLDATTVTISDLASVNVVLFYFDQVGTSTLPSVFTEGTAKSTFIQYLVEGGKMLLGGMATSYAETIGRDKSSMLTIKGNGSGFDSPDTWTIDGGKNFQNSKLTHPIYTFNQGSISFDGDGYIPVIDGGFREDHNNIWDAASLLNPGHELGQFGEFERLFGGKVLAVWGGVTDECCPGIIEFIPVEPFQGTIIAIGIGGIEFNMNDGRTNAFENNVLGIYKNSIDYLSTL